MICAESPPRPRSSPPLFPRYEESAFDYRRLAIALATRDRSYNLLMWISNAIDKGLILPSRAAHHSGGPEAATEWLRANYKIIPEDLRPSENAIDEFAAFFSTYLTSSFDVIQKPGTKGTGPIPQFACTCDLCVPLAARQANNHSKLSRNRKGQHEVGTRQKLPKLLLQPSFCFAALADWAVPVPARF